MNEKELRLIAEARCRQASGIAMDADPGPLVHELKVHQIELEMQNEQLREAQIALEQSRERYFDLYEFAPVGYLTLSQAGQIEQANLAAATMVGVQRSDLVGRLFVGFVADADRELCQKELLRAVNLGLELQFNVALRRQDGLPHQINLSCRAFKTDEGAPALRAALTDITVLKHAQEQKLRDAAVRFSAIFNGAPDAILLLDMETRRVLDGNPAACAALAYKHSELVKLSLPEIVATADMHKILEAFGHSPLPPSVVMLDVSMRRKNADVFSADVSAARLEVQARDCVMVFCRDTTARRNADAALRESEWTLRTALRYSPNAIFISNAVGRFVFVNEGAQTLLGYSAEELLQMGIADTLAPDGREITLNLLADPRKSRQQFAEAVFLCMDQRRIHVEIASAQLPTGNLLCEVRNITEAKRNAAELQQHRNHLEAMVQERTAALAIAKEAAEAASRAKSIFLANISHELRTPMTIIMGMTELSRRRVSNPKTAEQLGKALGSARQLLALLNDLINISDIEADRLALDNLIFSMDSFLQAMETSLKNKTAQKALQYAFEAETSIHQQWLQGDPGCLRQIVNHLIDNAVKFTEHGCVTARVRMLEQKGGYTRIGFEVQDTGIGISAEDQLRIFSLFEQGDASSTRKYSGTGLGLILSKRLVEMMGGQMGVSSQPGAGSTFWFTVTLGVAARPATGALPGPQPAGIGIAALSSQELAHLRKVCSKLLALIAASDWDALLELRHDAALFRQAAPLAYQELASALEEFDYDKAATTLQEIMQAFKINGAADGHNSANS